MIVSQNDKYIVAFELFTKDGQLLTEEIVNGTKSEDGKQTAITKDDIEFISMDCYFEVAGFPTCSINCKCRDTRIIANCALLSFSISTFVSKSTEDRDKLAVNFPATVYNVHWTSQWDCRIDCYMESFNAAFKKASFCFPRDGEMQIPDEKNVTIKRIGGDGKPKEVIVKVRPFEVDESGVVGGAGELNAVQKAHYLKDDDRFNEYTLTSIGTILKYITNFTSHKISDKVIKKLGKKVKRNYENASMMTIWDHLVKNSGSDQLYMNFTYIRVLGFDEDDDEVEKGRERIVPVVEPNGTIDAKRTFSNVQPSVNGVEYEVGAGKWGTIIKNGNGGVFNVMTKQAVLQRSDFINKLFKREGGKFDLPQKFIFMTKSPNFLTIGDKALVFNSKSGSLLPGYVIRERLTFTNIITGVYEIGCFEGDKSLLKFDPKKEEEKASK